MSGVLLSVKSTLRILVGATVVLYVATLLFYFSTRSEVTEIKGNLCSFRGDIENRVFQGNKFLVGHPKGLPGIPPGAIKVSILGEERTLRSLNGLSC